MKFNELYESILKEEKLPKGMKELAKELEGEIFDAYSHGDEVSVRKTTKTWPDGSPVIKYFDRGRDEYITLPEDEEFYIVETECCWYFKLGREWIRIDRDEYSSPPFDY
jgi:urate oxidase